MTSDLNSRATHAPDARYILVTPTKNEEALIRETLDSVVAQTVPPIEWVIVNDGSTDATAAIVGEYCARFPWIKLINNPPRTTRDFAAVVKATERGVASVSRKDYAFVGLLDSDVRFQPDYFERLMRYFDESPKLGVAGGVAIDIGHPRDKFPLNRIDVPGAVQFFRRECFESLGGLIAIPEGGWDGMTCARARMNGYETRLIVELVVDHLKPRNIAEGGLLRRKWQLGVRDYAVGYHPLFEFTKCLSRLKDPPYVIGGISWWVGYCSAYLRRQPRRVPQDLQAFIRREQMDRLRRTVRLPVRTP